MVGLAFYWTKTAFKPYDIAVTAALLIAKRHLRDKLVIHSDGGDPQWADAKELCHEHLGYGTWFSIVDDPKVEIWTMSDGAQKERHVTVQPVARETKSYVIPSVQASYRRATGHDMQIAKIRIWATLNPEQIEKAKRFVVAGVFGSAAEIGSSGSRSSSKPSPSSRRLVMRGSGQFWAKLGLFTEEREEKVQP